MAKIRIPNYSLSEEIINSVSHGIGVLFGITALVLTIIMSCAHHNTIGIVSSCIYGSSMIIMYLMSCLYHALSPRTPVKKVFRVIDHCDIYVYIAGCYTPFALSAIGGRSGWIIFAIIWACAVSGVVLNAVDLEKFDKVSLALYLIMGWMIIFSLRELITSVEMTGIVLLALGGIVYSIGAVLYVIGAKKKYMHSVFHFCVLAGSILQFFSILFYAL